MYSPSVLDLSTSDLRARFVQGARNVAAVSIAIKYPTLVSAAHSLASGLQNLLGIAAVTDVSFKQAEKIKEYLKDPSKIAAAAPAAAAPAAAAAAPAAKKEEAKEESDDDMGFGLFD